MTLTFVKEKESKDYRVKELDLLCSLPKIKQVVTIENYTAGCGHSAHPNIDRSGSVKGMKKLGYWSKHDLIIRQGGHIYNYSKIYCSNPLDELCLALETHNCETRYEGYQVTFIFPDKQ